LTHQVNRRHATSLGPLSQVFSHRVQVVVEASRVLLTGTADFFDWIAVLIGHGGSGSCSGVQMRGVAKPRDLHACSILSANVALARWRQFQVSRNETIVGSRFCQGLSSAFAVEPDGGSFLLVLQNIPDRPELVSAIRHWNAFGTSRP
jgi:hypothetical protein